MQRWQEASIFIFWNLLNISITENLQELPKIAENSKEFAIFKYLQYELNIKISSVMWYFSWSIYILKISCWRILMKFSLIAVETCFKQNVILSLHK